MFNSNLFRKMNDLNLLKKDGFQGFITIKELQKNVNVVPIYGGVYVVLRTKESNPVFLKTGTGGFFKGKDPNVKISKLEGKWINDSSIVYIGKADGSETRGLRKRLHEYMRFGQGEPVGHYGGRYIWQLEDASELIVCWKQVDGDAEGVEKQMISDFKKVYGKYPFANLRL